MDEVRISNIDRGSTWISAQNNNLLATSGYGDVSFCVADWACNGYATCDIEDEEKCNSAVDNNACGESYTGDYTEFTPNSCDYCTPDWECTTWGDCVDSWQNCTAVIDNNDCYATTGLPSDDFDGDYDPYGQACIEQQSSSGGFIAIQNSNRLKLAEKEECTTLYCRINEFIMALRRAFGLE